MEIIYSMAKQDINFWACFQTQMKTFGVLLTTNTAASDKPHILHLRMRIQ